MISAESIFENLLTIRIFKDETYSVFITALKFTSRERYFYIPCYKYLSPYDLLYIFLVQHRPTTSSTVLHLNKIFWEPCVHQISVALFWSQFSTILLWFIYLPKTTSFNSALWEVDSSSSSKRHSSTQLYGNRICAPLKTTEREE